MPKTTDDKKNKLGRPPTGTTKEKVAATIDIKVISEIRKLAFDKKVSSSSLLERAAIAFLASNKNKKAKA